MKKQILAAGLALATLSAVGSVFADTPTSTAVTTANVSVPATATVDFSGSQLNHNATTQEVVTGTVVNALILQINTKGNVAGRLYVSTGTTSDGGTPNFTLTNGASLIQATPGSVNHGFNGGSSPLTFDGGSNSSVNTVLTGSDYYQGYYNISLANVAPGNYTATLTASLYTP